jgi:hypothetical protein
MSLPLTFALGVAATRHAVLDARSSAKLVRNMGFGSRTQTTSGIRTALALYQPKV